MNDATREEIQAWLLKAKHDLTAARRLGAKRLPLLDVAIYHCQQAAEKAVKGFLVYHAHTPPKTHDIENLALLAAGYEPMYANLTSAGNRLTQYASGFRYPAPILEPSRAEYEQALADAAEFLRVTLSVIPREAHPPRPKPTPKPPT